MDPRSEGWAFARLSSHWPFLALVSYVLGVTLGRLALRAPDFADYTNLKEAICTGITPFRSILSNRARNDKPLSSRMTRSECEKAIGRKFSVDEAGTWAKLHARPWQYLEMPGSPNGMEFWLNNVKIGGALGCSAEVDDELIAYALTRN